MSRIAGTLHRAALRTALVALVALAAPALARAQDGPSIRAVRADPVTVDEGEVVAFEADAVHPDAAPMRYGWDFGDGTTLAPDPSASRTFAVYLDDGDYDAVVTVEDANGRTVEDSVRVTVRNVAPEIRGIDRDGATLERTDIAFRARVRDPGDDALRYRWDFGDGTVAGPSENLEVARHAYQHEGSYTVTLEVDDGDGGISTFRETIVVGAGFRFTASGAVTDSGCWPCAVSTMRISSPVPTTATAAVAPRSSFMGSGCVDAFRYRLRDQVAISR